MTQTHSLTAALFIGAMCSLGCLIPSPDLFPDTGPDPDPEFNNKEDKQGKPDLTITNNKKTGDPKDPVQNNNDKPYDPNSHDSRDNPNSDDYRGQFKATVSDKETFTLDGARLGEATFAFFDFDGLAEDPHCLISLIDQRADEQGRLGYILFKLPIESCKSRGSITLPIADDTEDAPSDAALIKAIQIEQDNAEGLNFTLLQGVEGKLIINDLSSRRIRATFNIIAKESITNDDGPQRVRATIDGDFEAILLNQ